MPARLMISSNMSRLVPSSCNGTVMWDRVTSFHIVK